MIKEEAGEPGRIALFGGSFDPVHCAHLKVAHCALEQAGLNRVVFLPASQSPLKRRPFSEDAARLKMLRLALRDENRFGLSTYEIEQNKVNYTVDTIDHFRELYSSAELFWIIGEDQFAQLDKWRRIDELVEKVVFLVYPRGKRKKVARKPVEGLRYHALEAKTMSVSSTKVRECCKKGLPIAGLVPGSVEAFICEQGLYRE